MNVSVSAGLLMFPPGLSGDIHARYFSNLKRRQVCNAGSLPELWSNGSEAGKLRRGADGLEWEGIRFRNQFKPIKARKNP